MAPSKMFEEYLNTPSTVKFYQIYSAIGKSFVWESLEFINTWNRTYNIILSIVDSNEKVFIYFRD